jgi:hypothetical protein
MSEALIKNRHCSHEPTSLLSEETHRAQLCRFPSDIYADGNVLTLLTCFTPTRSLGIALGFQCYLALSQMSHISHHLVSEQIDTTSMYSAVDTNFPLAMYTNDHEETLRA